MDRLTGRQVTGRAKVKSGCRTCKIRKVKCDEGRPACRRCVSTGRVCDGYGIWGGGGSPYGQLQRQRSVAESRRGTVPRAPATVSVLMPSSEEQGYFEWFRCRTAGKLPGSFMSSFWDTLLLQASIDEPAVLHAVLALSSVHKQGITNGVAVQTARPGIPDKEEQFTLQQYVKAIGQLQPHFSAKDRASFRVALIACVVFVSLELLRGHFKSAQLHLQRGLEILGEMQTLFSRTDGILSLKPSHEPNDDWIVEALSRLHLQVELFRHAYRHPCLVLQVQDTTPKNQALTFQSFHEAWTTLDRLFNMIFYLSDQARQPETVQCESPHGSRPELLELQRKTRIELSEWLSKFKEFIRSSKYQKSADEEKEKRYNVICPYHAMASIMLETCLQPHDEMVFDSHTDKFNLVINQSIRLWTAPSTPSPESVPPGLIMDMSRSIIDVGWIPPLYYTATKCRVHRIRLHAIKLLEASAHREGIWDSKTASLVAKKVMKLEEGDFYKDIDIQDDFPFASPSNLENLDLPALPDSHRLHEVEVVLTGAPMDRIQLFTKKRRQEKSLIRLLAADYDVRAASWVQGPGAPIHSIQVIDNSSVPKMGIIN